MTTTSVVEIERKFDVEDTVVLPPLQDLPGIARMDKPVEQRLEADYFDTRDLRLASAQITLRRRKGRRRRWMAPEVTLLPRTSGGNSRNRLAKTRRRGS